MRYLIVHPDIQLRNSRTGKPLKEIDDAGNVIREEITPTSNAVWLTARCDDQKVTATSKGVRVGARVVAAAEAAKEKTLLALQDDDWETVKPAVESPSGGYGPFGRQLQPFMDAFLEADTDKEAALKKLYALYPEVAPRPTNGAVDKPLEQVAAEA